MGFWVEDEGARSAHMFGALLPPGRDVASFFERLKKHNIFVSRRGEAVRISTHVYIEEKDVELFREVLMEWYVPFSLKATKIKSAVINFKMKLRYLGPELN